LLDELFSRVAAAGVRSVFVEHINLKPYIKQRLWQTLEQESEEIQEVYRGASTEEHRRALDEMVQQLLSSYGLGLRFNQVLYHNKAQDTNPSSMPSSKGGNG
jgi:hypothetical protein